jgi:hypothetical protein
MREKTGAEASLDFCSNPSIHEKHEKRERNPRLTRSYPDIVFLFTIQGFIRSGKTLYSSFASFVDNNSSIEPQTPVAVTGTQLAE